MRITAKQFCTVSIPLEGLVPTMYQDSIGLVTVAMGNLIEPISLGMGYPWRRKDGTFATTFEYIVEWNIINSKLELAQLGWRAAANHCKLHLTQEDMFAIVEAKLLSNEVTLKRRVKTYEELPADAHLMLHSWAWAVGPNAAYGRMLRLLNEKKLAAAVNECTINPQKGTIILRNAMNRQCLLNAQWVLDNGESLDELHYGTPFSGQADSPTHTVVQLQHALSLLGFTLAQDGVFGPKSREALTKFQGIHKLQQDGIAGPLTWAAIQQALRFR